MSKVECKLISIFLCLVVCTYFINVEFQKAYMNHINFNIKIKSISNFINEFSVIDLFDENNYTYREKSITLNLSSLKSEIQLSDIFKRNKTLDILFLNLLKDIQRIDKNINILRYVKKRSLHYSKNIRIFCV